MRTLLIRDKEDKAHVSYMPTKKDGHKFIDKLFENRLISYYEKEQYDIYLQDDTRSVALDNIIVFEIAEDVEIGSDYISI